MSRTDANRHGVQEIEMKDDLTFSAIAHSDKQISWQISTIVPEIEPTSHTDTALNADILRRLRS